MHSNGQGRERSGLTEEVYLVTQSNSNVYAWSSERDDGKRRFYAVLHMGPVTGPVEAVRAAIVAEGRASQ